MLVIETDTQVQDQCAWIALVAQADRSQQHMRPDGSETRVEKKE